MFRTLKTELGNSLFQFLREIRSDFLHLLKQELELAKAELRENAKNVIIVFVCWAVAGIFAIFCTILLTLSALYLLISLYPAVPLWGAYSILGFIFLLAAVCLYFIGQSKIRTIDFYPSETMDSLAKSFRMIREALK